MSNLLKTLTCHISSHHIQERQGPNRGAIEMKVNELERRLGQMSEEHETVAAERDNLIDLSNKLRADISRLQIHREHEQALDVHDSMESGAIRNLKSDRNQSYDGIDVHDLAKSVWTSAIGKPVRERKVSLTNDKPNIAQKNDC